MRTPQLTNRSVCLTLGHRLRWWPSIKSTVSCEDYRDQLWINVEPMLQIRTTILSLIWGKVQLTLTAASYSQDWIFPKIIQELVQRQRSQQGRDVHPMLVQCCTNIGWKFRVWRYGPSIEPPLADVCSFLGSWTPSPSLPPHTSSWGPPRTSPHLKREKRFWIILPHLPAPGRCVALARRYISVVLACHMAGPRGAGCGRPPPLTHPDT